MKTAVTKSVGLRATAGTRRLSFGLVTVTVGTAPALDVSARISGHRVDPATMTRVKQAWLSESGDLVDPITAYPHGDGYVILEDHEKPELDGDGTVALEGSIESLPLEWVQGTYLAWPSDSSQDAAYCVLAGYLRDTGRTLVGRTVDHGTTKVLAVRWSPVYRIVTVHTVAYHDQVRWGNVATVSEAVIGMPDVPDALKAAGAAAFGSIPDGFDWESVRDEYGERLYAAVLSKAAGESVPAAATDKSGGDVMGALLAALEATAR